MQIVITNHIGTNAAGGALAYTFPVGNIYVMGFEINDFEFKTNATSSVIANTATGQVSFGTVIGSGTNLLTTEIDFTDGLTTLSPVTSIVDIVTALAVQFLHR